MKHNDKIIFALLIAFVAVLFMPSLIKQGIDVGIAKEILDSVTYRTQTFWFWTVPSMTITVAFLVVLAYYVFKSDNDKAKEDEQKHR